MRTLKQKSRDRYQYEMKQARKVAVIINRTIEEFISSGNGYRTPYDINNGGCEEFVQVLLVKLGGETDRTFILASDMFGDYGILQRNFKSVYGNLPAKVKRDVNLGGHLWVYHNGRHYDAEAPEGVKNFLHLPILKKAVDKAAK